MILFIGTHIRLLLIVMLVTLTAGGPHLDDPGEQHQDDQGNTILMTGYIESPFGIGQLVVRQARFATS